MTPYPYMATNLEKIPQIHPHFKSKKPELSTVFSVSLSRAFKKIATNEELNTKIRSIIGI